ncbi:hypothetical protein AX17_000153 [Amanita inopinata Kibby_2008]|nr:hypothetical protein AX17_000153 [Amanita inopinata Kibby_2008]
MNAYDEVSLQELAAQILPGVSSKRGALEKNLEGGRNGTLHVSEKVVKLWQERKERLDTIYDVLTDASRVASDLTPGAKKKREEFLSCAKNAWEVNLKEVVLKINDEIIGPFTLGDQYSIADVHLAAWLARVMKLAKVEVGDEGNAAIAKLEKRIGSEGFLAQNSKWGTAEGDDGRAQETKLGTFWNAVKGRESWKRVYKEGLH